MNLIYILLAILAGVLFAIQPVLNNNVARILERPIQASLISFFVGTVLLVIVNLFLGIKIPSTDRLLAVPWWLYLSGGAMEVTKCYFANYMTVNPAPTHT